MNIDKHREVQAQCAERADYFKVIDFPIIASTFESAANSLQELIETIDKLNNPTMATITVSEEGGNG
jgi:hypothetical protein